MLVVGASLLVASLAPPASRSVALFAGSGATVAALAAAAARHIRAGRKKTFDTSFATAMPEWRAGRRAALEGMVAEFAGPAATAHALRCATLVDLLSGQFAIPPEEVPDLVLAAALHVLPAAFADADDPSPERCQFAPAAVAAALVLLRRVAPPVAARIAGEAGERWDGSGIPARLLGEQCSIGGRILAVVCRFDHESNLGLEPGLGALRAASGTAFDPVVVSELVHLFREPWPLRPAA